MPEFPPLPARLIFNPTAGPRSGGAKRMAEVITLLHGVNIEVDAVQAQGTEQVIEAAAQAVAQGFDLVIACGGDGTVETVANAVIGSGCTLGILPAGTRNNVARSLGIPTRLPEAVRLLRTGQRCRIGAGHAQVAANARWFLETFSVGLFSLIYPHADAVQKGNLLQMRSLLATFLSAPLSKMYVEADDAVHIELLAHALLGVNMPSTGAFFRLGENIAYDDEHIDIFLYDRLDKLDFLVYGFDVLTGMPEDPAIARLRARTAVVRADPPLPVMADGFDLGVGDVAVRMEPAILPVLAPPRSLASAAYSR